MAKIFSRTNTNPVPGSYRDTTVFELQLNDISYLITN